MNNNDILLSFIDNYPCDEPIFIEEIKDYFKKILKNNFEQAMKSIYVYINRLVHNNVLHQFSKGIYYKPLKGEVGYKKLDANKVITKKYLNSNGIQKGYLSGAYLFNELGLTTQIPKNILIVTNECPNKNDYNNKTLNVTIRKPKIKVNNDNYKYLQLFDILTNKDKINIEVENELEVIYKFINENDLKIDAMFEYAKMLNNFNAIKKLYEMS